MPAYCCILLDLIKVELCEYHRYRTLSKVDENTFKRRAQFHLGPQVQPSLHLFVQNLHLLNDITSRHFIPNLSQIGKEILMFACPCIVSIIRNLWPTRCNFWFICLYPISSTCFGRCFRPASGALDCICSFWYCPPMLLPAGVMDEIELRSISSMTPAGSNRGGLYQKL